MSNPKPLNIAFLWHMHQPYYNDLLNGEYMFPWVRFHSTKDYYDMLLILEKYPSLRQNYNLTPSLIEQIDDYVSGNAKDRFFELSKTSPGQLTTEEKIFVIHNFFMANWNNMIKRFPRYMELLKKRGRHVALDELSDIAEKFSDQDIVDLQVLFNIVWIDPYFHWSNKELSALVAKGRDYNEQDKDFVLKLQLEIMGNVINKYKELQEKGQIEISVSPYYHPILPLIYDTESARMSMPNDDLPKERFSHPEDVRQQVKAACECYEEHFGIKPRGMWPSEGAVSEDIIPILRENGIEWMATDEDILGCSLGEKIHQKDMLYNVYSITKDGHSMNMVFRNRKLSDLIGFTYENVFPDAAVDHFMKEIHQIIQKVSNFEGPHLLNIILDGENCWENYHSDGWDFLCKLYSAIENDPLMESITIGDFIHKFGSKRELPKLWSGSWINHDFRVWIGHEEDNLSWDYLTKTRQALENYIKENPDLRDNDQVKKAWKEIYISEGSDWNWWYGDDHTSGNDESFDNLYRTQLMNVFRLIEHQIPDWLHIPICGQARSKPSQEPRNFVNPIIDGRVTTYFEWHDAGRFDVSRVGGTMHQTESIVQTIFYGFDLNNLFIRIDTNIALSPENVHDLSIKLSFLSPSNIQVKINFDPENVTWCMVLRSATYEENNESLEKHKLLTSISCQKIIEVSIPFAELDRRIGDKVELIVILERGGIALERWPNRGAISFEVPGKNFAVEHWIV